MENWAFNIGSFIAGMLGGGIVGSLVTLSFTKKMRSDGNGSAVDQSGATAGGDIVGRDKKG